MADDLTAGTLPTALLMQAYRSSRSLLLDLEAMLLARGALKCAKCRRLHPPLEPPVDCNRPKP